MAYEEKQASLRQPVDFSLFHDHLEHVIVSIPFLAVAYHGWQLASKAFAGERKKYRTLQQWKSFFAAFFNPLFASTWFKILKSPYFLLVTTHRQRLYFKPFRVYMSIRWSKKKKLKVILDTYRFISDQGKAFMHVITRSGGIEIARFKLDDTMDGFINLGYDERYRKEGELVLSFGCDQFEEKIAAAAFSFEEVENGCWVCRIGCIQGHTKNNDNPSKTTQKLMHGLRPKSLLIYTLQEFSRQLGFTAVYGVGDSIQAYRRKHAIHLPWLHNIQFDYNAIWRESGGRPDRNGWYELPLTPVRKSINEIKTNKRALYSRRYRLLDDLSLQISDAAKGLLYDVHNSPKGIALQLFEEYQPV